MVLRNGTVTESSTGNYYTSSISKQIFGEDIPGLGDQDIDPSEFVNKPLHKDETIDHGNGVIQRFYNGDEYWHKDGKFHRDGDKPAVFKADGTMHWYRHGKLHRDGDKPAVIDIDGYKAWYCNGLLHRDGDKPAIIRGDGSQEWYKYGLLHCDNDLPAVINADGTKKWYRNCAQYRQSVTR